MIHDLVSPAARLGPFQRQIPMEITPPPEMAPEGGRIIEHPSRQEFVTGAVEILTTPESTVNEEWGNRPANQVRCWIQAKETTVTPREVVSGNVVLTVDDQRFRAFDFQRLGPTIRLTAERPANAKK